MKQVISWVIGLPIAVVLIAFALANRSFVTISLDPLSSEAPWFALSLPLWAVLFVGIFLGLVIGWIASWVNQGKWRKAAREARTNLDIEMGKKKDLERRLNQGEFAVTQPQDRF